MIAAVELSKHRGTVQGLAKFLSLALGSGQFKIHENLDSTGKITPFHLWIEADDSLKLQRPLPDGALKIVATGQKEDPIA